MLVVSLDISALPIRERQGFLMAGSPPLADSACARLPRLWPSTQRFPPGSPATAPWRGCRRDPPRSPPRFQGLEGFGGGGQGHAAAAQFPPQARQGRLHQRRRYLLGSGSSGSASRSQRLAFRAWSLVERTKPTNRPVGSAHRQVPGAASSTRASVPGCGRLAAGAPSTCSVLPAQGSAAAAGCNPPAAGAAGVDCGTGSTGSPEVQPVLRMPAAMPLIVSRAPRSSSLRL